MFSKTIQKNMLVLGGLFLLAQNTIPAALAADWLTEPQAVYIKAATSADPIIFEHNNQSEVNITVEDNADDTAIVKKVEDNYVPTIEDIKNYVRQEAKKAGLSIKEVETIINCESKWDSKVVSKPNTNGSIDRGLWQINSIHKNISDAEKLDYKAATKWAIEKRLRDGNWSAWSCSRKLAVK